MKSVEKAKYYKTKGVSSEFDSYSFSLLLKTYIRKVAGFKDLDGVFQALHNYYAKKLKIPSVQVECSEDLGYDGMFDVVAIKDSDENNVFIKIGKFLEYEAGLFYSINVVLHETKHAHQAYIYHKFLVNGVIPGSQHEKMLLLFKVLSNCGDFENMFYCSSPEELDSYIFEINEMNEIFKRYEILNNESLRLFRNETIFKTLYMLEYNKEGVNNKFLKDTIKIIKRSVYKALHLEYGEETKRNVERIIKSGFDIDKSFNFIVDNLNRYCDEQISAHLLACSQGYNTRLSLNGNMIYSVEEDSINDQQINPDSQYAKFLFDLHKKEYEKSLRLVEDIVKGMSN